MAVLSTYAAFSGNDSVAGRSPHGGRGANGLNDGADDSLGEFQALASEATFDRVMFEGAEFGLQAEPGSRGEQTGSGDRAGESLAADHVLANLG